MTSVTAIILTLNEELHLERCLWSLRQFVEHVIVVDSYSNDRTIEIAQKNGAYVIQREFTNHAEQFNWALEAVHITSDWIFRLDADEIITSEAPEKITNVLSSLSPEVAGVTVNRSIMFQGKFVKFGGVGKRRILRLFRNGRGMAEHRRMDEHLVVSGSIAHVNASIIDHNLRPISWWVSKHNDYSTKEAIEMLFPLSKNTTDAANSNFRMSQESQQIRNLKQSLYLNCPLCVRALIYFLYRYFIKFGFLDHQFGVYHILSAFWYRMLVDLKIIELQKVQEKEGLTINQAVERFLKYDK